jgi:hypothetical protein
MSRSIMATCSASASRRRREASAMTVWQRYGFSHGYHLVLTNIAMENGL